MEAKNGNKKLWLLILRWSARIIAILIAIFFLLMFLGEGIQNHSPNAQALVARDYILLSLKALYLIGLIIGLWREGLGGLISLVFMMTQIAIHQTEGVGSAIFYYMLMPSILFILSWYFHRRLSTLENTVA